MALVLLASSAARVEAYVEGDGKGKPEADCFIGLEGYDDGDLSPFGKKGKPAIQCTDCDPSCDLDGVSTPNGSCTFSIAVRINDAGDPTCEPSPLQKAKAKAKTKGTKIDFSSSAPPPLDGSSATSSFVNFPVLVKAKKKGDKPGTGKLQVLAKKAEKPKLTDKDKFLFVCNPLPEGESCAGETTTTTTVETTTTTVETTTSTTVETTTSTTVETTTSTTVVTTTSTTILILPTGVLPLLTTTTTSTTTSTIIILPTGVLPLLTTTTFVLPTGVLPLLTTTTTSTTTTTILILPTGVLPLLTTTTIVILPTGVLPLLTTTTSSTSTTILLLPTGVLPLLTTTTIAILPTGVLPLLTTTTLILPTGVLPIGF